MSGVVGDVNSRSGVIDNFLLPAGQVLQTLSDNYNSQTEATSDIKVCEITFTTKKEIQN